MRPLPNIFNNKDNTWLIQKGKGTFKGPMTKNIFKNESIGEKG